jgi:oxygen-dependent protoporphyrinogen oxidase
MKRIAVIGGGITGLAAAHRIREIAGDATELLLLEGRERVGGSIGTLHRDGLVLEEGPDSILTEKPWAVALAERLGLADRLVGTQDGNRRSFVVRRGKLHPTPDGFYLLAPARMWPLVTTGIFSPLGKLRMGLDLILPRRRSQEDESVGSFVLRRLGREALDRMAQPMIGGIYGADPMKLSLQATFPRFLQMERDYGSVIRALWAGIRKRKSAQASGARYGLFVTFDDGLQVLVDELVRRLPEGAIRTGSAVQRIEPAAGRWKLVTEHGGEIVDGVISALPAYRSSDLVRGFDRDLAARLKQIPYGSSAIVSLAYPESDVPHAMDGFGFVVPDVEGLSILGCTFCHRKYPNRAPEGMALLRSFHGSRTAGQSPEELIASTRRDLELLLGIRSEPRTVHTACWPGSMPHYPVGHATLVERIEARLASHPNLALAGNAYHGLGLPDCIHSGEGAAESILEQLAVVN